MAKQQSTTAALILRSSTHTFLQHFHFFTSTPSYLAFPFAAAVLLSQAATAPAAAGTIFNRLQSLSRAAGFPTTSQLFTLLNLKLSQTIAASIYTLPFSLTFFLLAKSSVFAFLKNRAPSRPVASVFRPMVLTHITNLFLIISVNSSVFSLMFLSFNFLSFPTSPVSLVLVSVLGAVVYSVMLASAFVVCNLAVVVSAMEGKGGYVAVMKAAAMMQGRVSTALSLALPINLAMAGTEALFQYRVVGGNYYRVDGTTPWGVGLEAVLICYVYSMLVVLDAIVGFFFFESIRGEMAARKCGGFGEDLEMGSGCWSSLKVDDDGDDGGDEEEEEEEEGGLS